MTSTMESLIIAPPKTAPAARTAPAEVVALFTIRRGGCGGGRTRGPCSRGLRGRSVAWAARPSRRSRLPTETGACSQSAGHTSSVVATECATISSTTLTAPNDAW